MSSPPAPSEGGPLLALRDATIGHRGGPRLEGVDLEVRAGDFWGIVGPNGAGKTTLLQTLLGMLPPLAGARQVREGLRIGYVPQRSVLDAIFPLSALQVVSLGAMGRGRGGWLGRLRSAPRAKAMAALERLGVEGLAAKPFRALSGGQQQRVLIARGLVRDPDVLVLDEPTQGMDIPSEGDILCFVDALNRGGVTVLLVAHQIEVVATHAAHMALVSMHSGRFATGGTQELVTTERLAALYGRPLEVSLDHGRIHVEAHPQAACAAGEIP